MGGSELRASGAPSNSNRLYLEEKKMHQKDKVELGKHHDKLSVYAARLAFIGHSNIASCVFGNELENIWGYNTLC